MQDKTLKPYRSRFLNEEMNLSLIDLSGELITQRGTVSNTAQELLSLMYNITLRITAFTVNVFQAFS